MANELIVSVSLDFLKSGRKAKDSEGGLQIDVSGDAYVHHIQNIGTSEEALDMGDLGTPGYCLMRNLDSTNYVEIRPGTGDDDMLRLNAGEVCLFRFAADVTAPYAIANTAAVDLEYLIIEA